MTVCVNAAQHSQDGPLVKWLRDWQKILSDDTEDVEDLIVGSKAKRKRGLGSGSRREQ